MNFNKLKNDVIKGIDLDQWKYSWHNDIDNPLCYKKLHDVLTQTIDG